MAYDSLIRALLEDQGNELLLSPAYTTGVGLRKSLGSLGDYKLKPWEAVLAGALTGLAGGALEGIGRSTAESRNEAVTSKLLSALGAKGEDRYNQLKDDPDTAKFATLLKVSDVADQQALELGLSEYEQKQRLQQQIDMEHPKYSLTQIGAGGGNEQVFGVNQYNVNDRVPIGEPYPKYDPTLRSGGLPIPPEEAGTLAELASALSGVPSEKLAPLYRSGEKARITSNLVAQRGTEGRSLRGVETKERMGGIPGYEPISDNFIQGSEEAAKLREKVGESQVAISLLEDIAATKDLNAITGQDAATLGALMGGLKIASRRLQGTGANYTKNEEGILNAMTPQIAAGDLFGALKAGALGKDQRVFAQTLQSIVQKTLDVELLARGQKNVTKNLSDYPASLIKRLGLGEQAQAGGFEMQQSGGSVPKRQPGETVSAYKARLGAQ